MDDSKESLVIGTQIDVLQLVKQELNDPEYEKSWKVIHVDCCVKYKSKLKIRIDKLMCCFECCIFIVGS